MSSAELTIGHIPYLNCVPFFHHLADCGFTGRQISGVPAELNRMLQQGRLDISPSSSFEYARNWKEYQLLADHSISAVGKVYSVLLFSPVELSQLAGRQIAITGESATSINLLRIILREFVGLKNVTDVVPERPVEQLIADSQPALLIGDRALRLAENQPRDMHCYDLGEIWHRHTGLPFVFALWMIRRDAVPRFPVELAQLGRQLQQSSERFLANPDPVAMQLTAAAGLSAEQIVDYWRRIDYCLDAEHLKGLQLFFDLCVKHDLLSQSPPLDFYSPEE